MKSTKHLLFIIFIIPTLISVQKYLQPVPGGLENIANGDTYVKVEIKDKSAKEIYDALHAMLKEVYKGEGDEIPTTIEGESLIAKGI